MDPIDPSAAPPEQPPALSTTSAAPPSPPRASAEGHEEEEERVPEPSAVRLSPWKKRGKVVRSSRICVGDAITSPEVHHDVVGGSVVKGGEEGEREGDETPAEDGLPYSSATAGAVLAGATSESPRSSSPSPPPPLSIVYTASSTSGGGERGGMESPPVVPEVIPPLKQELAEEEEGAPPATVQREAAPQPTPPHGQEGAVRGEGEDGGALHTSHKTSPVKLEVDREAEEEAPAPRPHPRKGRPSDPSSGGHAHHLDCTEAEEEERYYDDKAKEEVQLLRHVLLSLFPESVRGPAIDRAALYQTQEGCVQLLELLSQDALYIHGAWSRYHAEGKLRRYMLEHNRRRRTAAAGGAAPTYTRRTHHSQHLPCTMAAAPAERPPSEAIEFVLPYRAEEEEEQPGEREAAPPHRRAGEGESTGGDGGNKKKPSKSKSNKSKSETLPPLPPPSPPPPPPPPKVTFRHVLVQLTDILPPTEQAMYAKHTLSSGKLRAECVEPFQKLTKATKRVREEVEEALFSS